MTKRETVLLETALGVGHIDEVVCFLGANTVLIADTSIGMSLIQQFDNTDTEDNGTVTGGTTHYIEDLNPAPNWDTSANGGKGEWANGYVEIRNQTSGAVEVRQVIKNTTNRVYVYDDQTGEGRLWAGFPNGDTWTYNLVARSEHRAMLCTGSEDFGVASSVNGTTLIDSTRVGGRAWSPNQWQNGYIMVFRGLNGEDSEWQTKEIQSSGTNSITIAGNWDLNASSSPQYYWRSKWSADPPDETCRYVLVTDSKMYKIYTHVYFEETWTTLYPACVTVRKAQVDYGAFQATCQETIDEIRSCLADPNGPFNYDSDPQHTDDFIQIPAVFTNATDAGALVPGMVNLLNQGTLSVPDPFGPRSASQDVFKQAFTDLVGQVSFVDCWPLHDGDGEIHCGTNVKRTVPAVDWW